MNLRDLFFKKPEGKGGGEGDNPYLTARRTWNEHVGGVVSTRQTWQVIGILSLLLALGSVGGLIFIGSQSRFVPYVVEVDRHGRAVAAGPVSPTARTDPRILKSAVAAFIENARLVTPDAALQRKAVLAVYAHLAPNDPAMAKMNEWMNGTPEASPFARAAKEMVSVEIHSVLPQTASTWQVEWTETTRDRKGVLTEPPASMRGLVTVYAGANPQATEEQMRVNPLGIFVRDCSWSRLQS